MAVAGGEVPRPSVLQFWAILLGGGSLAGAAAGHRRQMAQNWLAGALPPCAWAWPWAWGLWAQGFFSLGFFLDYIKLCSILVEVIS